MRKTFRFLAVNTRENTYPDLVFRLVLALLGSHIIISFGEKESFFELLLMPDYYRALAGSFGIAFILLWLVRIAVIRLDKRYGWKERPVARVGLQFLFGLLLPAIAAFLLATVYFRLYGLYILDTVYLKYDFPVILIMLLVVNLYYILFYFYRLSEQLTKQEKQESPAVTEPVLFKETFVVQSGAKNIPLPISTIAYFYRDGDYNYLRTFDDDRFLVSETLDIVEAQLNPLLFFRANRQLIVQHKACRHFVPLDFGKLQLFVIPEYKEIIVISQRRSKSFKDWMNR